MDCEFCNKKFSSTSALNYHKANTKYCLKIQGKITENTKDHTCNYCNKSFAYKQTLDSHIETCNMKEIKIENEGFKNTILEQTEKITEYEKEVKLLKDEIYKKDLELVEIKTLLNVYKDSQECLKEIAKQPKNTTKNNLTFMNMPVFNLTKDTIEDKIKNNFTREHLRDGQNGVANFAVNNLLKDEDENLMYICTDPSRNMFAFKTEDGTIEKDFKANKLTKLITDDVIKHATSISDDSIKTNIRLSEIRELKTDNSKFINKMSNLLYKTGSIHIKNEDSDSEFFSENDDLIDDFKVESDIEEYIEKLNRFNEQNPKDDGVIATYFRKDCSKKIEEKRQKLQMIV